MEDSMMTIRQLNQQLREQYEGARNIRHYQWLNGQYVATMLTTDAMPNTGTPGRIFVGYTEVLLQQA